MSYKITVGKYRVAALDSVTIIKSVENLADTATVVLPGTYINRALQVEDKISVGDKVEIWLGYDDDLKMEFTGYLNSIATDDATIKLECEDALYLFRKSLKDREYKSISLKKLLGEAVAEINKINAENKTPTNYTVKCDYDFTWENFTFFKTTAFDILKKIQDETKANIYFKDEVLHIHPPYSEIINSEAVIFDFARNIEKADLKYVKASDKNIEVEVTYTKSDGKMAKKTFGNPGGQKISRTIGAADEQSLKNAAESEYNLWVYDGYEGSITCWLIPYVEPAYHIELRDSEYEYKNGKYYVVSTETSFDSSGGVRKIKLGRKTG
ncbi:MAG: hypothetical protein LBF59_10425 [Prevotellaceae bacterium]|nr:hypothetical protein [Prevotellaceae bacterium]